MIINPLYVPGGQVIEHPVVCTKRFNIMSEPTSTEKFVKNMTYQMFSDFYHAMHARLHTDESLNRYLNPKASLAKNEVDLVKCGEIIKAIKEIRQRTGLGLRESKELVDCYILQHKHTP